MLAVWGFEPLQLSTIVTLQICLPTSSGLMCQVSAAWASDHSGGNIDYWLFASDNTHPIWYKDVGLRRNVALGLGLCLVIATNVSHLACCLKGGAAKYCRDVSIGRILRRLTSSELIHLSLDQASLLTGFQAMPSWQKYVQPCWSVVASNLTLSDTSRALLARCWVSMLPLIFYPRSLLHLLVTSSPPKWAVDGVSSLQISSLPSAALSIHLPALSACGAAVFPSLPLVALVSRLTRVFRSCYYWSWCWYSESCGSCIDPRDFPSSASTYSWLLLPNVRIHRNLLRRYYDLWLTQTNPKYVLS